MKLSEKYPKQRGGPVTPFIPLLAAAVGAGGSAIIANQNKPKALQAPQPPTQDAAASTALEQQQMLLRRKGVLANIFAGQNASAPVAKSQLGN